MLALVGTTIDDKCPLGLCFSILIEKSADLFVSATFSCHQKINLSHQEIHQLMTEVRPLPLSCFLKTSAPLVTSSALDDNASANQPISLYCQSTSCLSSDYLTHNPRAGTWVVPCRPGPLVPRAVSGLHFQARSAHRAVPCQHGKSFTKPKHGPWHAGTPSCRAGPNMAL